MPKDDWQIDPSKTAVLVVDMQKAFLDPEAPRQLPGGRETVPQINELTELGRKLRMPVVFLRHANRPDLSDYGLRKEFNVPEEHQFQVIEGMIGAEFDTDLNIAEEDHVVTKIRYSAFIGGSSTLEPLLRGLGCDSIILCGILTDRCVLTTAMCAMMLDFKVFCISDLTATLSEERQRLALEMIDERYAKVMTFAQVTEELQRLLARAGV